MASGGRRAIPAGRRVNRSFVAVASLAGAFSLACLVGIAGSACSAASQSAPPADAGAPEAAACPPPRSVGCADPAQVPSYSAQVAPTIEARCSPCHFPGGVIASMFDLSTYAGVVNAQTAILGQLYACSMPPTQGSAQYGIAPGTVQGISAAQAATIEDWILCGAPDN